MKILILLLAFILSGCANDISDKKEDYKDMSQYAYTDFSQEIMDLQVPKHYAEKNGSYGIYFTDYKNIIFVREIDENEDLQEELINGLNFYNVKDFPLDGKYSLEKMSNDEYNLSSNIGDFKSSKIKLRNKRGKVLILLVTSKEDDVGELYDEVTKQWGNKYWS